MTRRPSRVRSDIPELCRAAPAGAAGAAAACAGAGDDALLAHPEDCRLFYYCVEGAPVCRQCPAGLHFSPHSHVCDQPDHAGCQPAATTA